MQTNKQITSTSDANITMKTIDRTSSQVLDSSSNVMTSNNQQFIWFSLSYNQIDFASYSSVKLRFKQSNVSTSDIVLYKSNDRYMITSTTFKTTLVNDNNNIYREVDISSEIINKLGETLYFAFYIEGSLQTEISLYTNTSSETPKIICKYNKNDLTKNQKYVKGSNNGLDQYIVNTRNGKLNYSMNLFNTYGEHLSTSLTITYNEEDTFTSSVNGFPIGWKLNYYQYVKVSGSNYLYYDENNVVHTFTLANNLTSSSTNKIYYDKDNTYLTLKVDSTSTEARYVITNNQNIKYEFNASGLLVKIIKQTSENYQHEINNTYDSSNRLTSITDAGELTTTISYDTTNKKISITKPNGHKTIIQYDDNNCMSLITNNNKTTSFTYKEITIDGIFLSRALELTNKYYLLTAITTDQYRNTFTYINDSKKINKIIDYIYKETGFIVDRTTNIKYFHGLSKIEIHPSSETRNDASQYFSYYYNENGECVKVEEKNYEGNVLSFATYQNNNGIISTFKPTTLTKREGDTYSISCDCGTSQNNFLLNPDEYIAGNTQLQNEVTYKVLIKYSFEQKSTVNTSLTTNDDSFIEILENDDNILAKTKLNQPSDFNNEVLLNIKTKLVSPILKITNSNPNHIINITYIEAYEMDNNQKCMLFNFNNGEVLAEVEEDNYYKYDNIALNYTFDGQTNTLTNIEFSFNDLLNNKENYFKAKKVGNTTYDIFYNDGQNMLSNVNDVKYVFDSNEKTIESFKFLMLSGNEYFYDYRLVLYNFDANNFQRISMKCNKAKYFQSTKTFIKQEIDDYGNVINDINEEGRINIYKTNAKGNVFQIVSYSILNSQQQLYYTFSYNNNRKIEEKECYLRNFVGNKYEYDTMGKIAKLFDVNESNPLVNYTYDTTNDNNLTHINFPQTSTNETHFISYLDDNVSQISKNNTVFNYLYDYKNNVTQVEICGEIYCNISYDYNAVNPTKTITYANNEQERITYDKYGRIVKVEIKKSDETEFSELYSNDYTTNYGSLYSESVLSKTNYITDSLTYFYDYNNRITEVSNMNIKTTYEYLFNITDYGNLCTTVTESKTYINDQQIKKEQRACSKIEQNQGYPTYIYDCHVFFDDIKTYVEQIYLDEFSRRKKDYLYVFDMNYLNEFEYANYNEYVLSNFISKQKFSIGKMLENKTLQETIDYNYDAKGNIISISSEQNSVSYEYDSYNNLKRENNQKLATTTYYTYDNNGNILTKSIFDYTTNTTLTTPIQVINYQYSTDGKNKLISYDNKSITYNNMMQPTSINNYELKWEFNKLLQYDTSTFTYDALGRRTTKTTNNKSTVFVYEQDKLLKQTFPNGEELLYVYGSNGVIGCRHTKDGVTKNYSYQKNILGDIIAIYYTNSDGTCILKSRYIYDAWGNHQVLLYNNESEETGTSIGEINPFRYRGYYFDVETQLYWVSSRYYSPELCRFISPDSVDYLDPSSINGLNLYCYCYNNPISYYDPSGHSALLIIGLLAGSFALGFGISVVGQGLSHGWDEINYWQAGIDGLIALGTTALSFTGIPAWGMALVGAGTGFGQYAMDCGFHNEQMTWLGAGTATILGGIFGFIGGPGVRNSKAIIDDMVGLSDDGIRAINAITKAANNRTANRISQRGFQATINRYGKIAFNAVQDAIPGTIRHLMLKGIAPGIYLPIANAGVSYLLGYAYEELGWC